MRHFFGYFLFYLYSSTMIPKIYILKSFWLFNLCTYFAFLILISMFKSFQFNHCFIQLYSMSDSYLFLFLYLI